MPQHQNYPSNGHVVDIQTAVKDGLLGRSPAISVAATFASSPVELKVMIEHLGAMEEPVEVPSLFICPISLEPMTDPVTLCTGQTYDRANIQRWLALGCPSCPTTMQELWDASLTPNATLHQLILAWFTHHYHLSGKLSSGADGRAAHLLRSLRHSKGHTKARVLGEIRLFLSQQGAARSIADAGGLSAIASLLGPFTSHSVGSEAIALLVSLPIDTQTKNSLMQPAKISFVVDVLNEGTPETRLHCVTLIETLLLLEEETQSSFTTEMSSSLSLLVGLLRMLRDRKNPTGAWPSLRLMKTLCATEQARRALVHLGAVTHLVELLPELPVEPLEAALQVLEQLSGLEEGREAVTASPPAIPNLVRVVMRVSEACTRRALTVLLTICEEESVAAAVEAGVAARLLLLMQSGCPPELKQQAAALLKLCSRNCTATRLMSKCKLSKTMQ